MNESIFGPLQVKGEFGYDVSEVSGVTKELVNYINSIGGVDDLSILNLSKEIEGSVFTRVIRVDLGHINPIIGLITVEMLYGYTYNITHISVHSSFRGQGLANLLLMTLAKYISGKGQVIVNEVVSIVIPGDMDDLIMMFRHLKFNEIRLDPNYYMLKSTSQFVSIMNAPCLIG